MSHNIFHLSKSWRRKRREAVLIHSLTWTCMCMCSFCTTVGLWFIPGMKSTLQENSFTGHIICFWNSNHMDISTLRDKHRRRSIYILAKSIVKCNCDAVRDSPIILQYPMELLTSWVFPIEKRLAEFWWEDTTFRKTIRRRALLLSPVQANFLYQQLGDTWDKNERKRRLRKKHCQNKR